MSKADKRAAIHNQKDKTIEKLLVSVKIIIHLKVEEMFNHLRKEAARI